MVLGLLTCSLSSGLIAAAAADFPGSPWTFTYLADPVLNGELAYSNDKPPRSDKEGLFQSFVPHRSRLKRYLYDFQPGATPEGAEVSTNHTEEAGLGMVWDGRTGVAKLCGFGVGAAAEDPAHLVRDVHDAGVVDVYHLQEPKKRRLVVN
ncbi:uncharacterized protein PV07_03007 [Cladophialophora immunda]|uniref:Uncharacterized protein n=1 Tax=Cladophialophora immunda TaxID=569365 RepID=A0A0D2CMS0_9EURO|nr:uncharacterized protein PV07_03007 [Cladophialophora immunda]KIW31350.1 hypothetical protein PV07_03007 [Cladophialophora immunda]